MASEEKSFENVNGRTDGRTDARTDGRMDDGRKVITIAHPEQSSGELKRTSSNKVVFRSLKAPDKASFFKQKN